jgi:hypothetical protein
MVDTKMLMLMLKLRAFSKRRVTLWSITSELIQRLYIVNLVTLLAGPGDGTPSELSTSDKPVIHYLIRNDSLGTVIFAKVLSKKKLNSPCLLANNLRYVGTLWPFKAGIGTTQPTKRKLYFLSWRFTPFFLLNNNSTPNKRF